MTKDEREILIGSIEDSIERVTDELKNFPLMEAITSPNIDYYCKKVKALNDKKVALKKLLSELKENGSLIFTEVENGEDC